MDKSKKENSRPPIVTIMGHVDHGKTTLLDTIRKTNIAKKEHGGITQHIGAYQITHNSKQITFIDTPGHAAFEKMRSRGAEIADIVVLVVAVNDGVKPQTVEAIKHIKAAKKPIIVAITKVDLENTNPEKAKKDLQGHDVIVENYGGDVPTVEVSATKGKGIDELLDVIDLVWQLSPEEAKPNDPLQAVVVESFMDKNRGPVTSVIVKSGTLQVGQKLQFDQDFITVKALIDDLGKNVKVAEPGKPVEILGFKNVLDVGTVIADTTLSAKTQENQTATTHEQLIAKSQEVKDKFKVILKADVFGSLEAIIENLPEKILIIDSGVGDVELTDVSTAKIAHAPILAFNVKISNAAQEQADRESVLIRKYNVIYQLLDELKEITLSFEEAKFEQKIKGKAKVIASFEIEGKRIAGCQVTAGKIKVGDNILIKDSQGNIKETTINSLKKFKKEVETVTQGQECGIAFNANVDFKEGDIIESLG